MNLYLARDMDGRLEAYPVRPCYVKEPCDIDGTGLWLPDKTVDLADLSQFMPRDWADEVKPGQCVELETAKPAVVLDGELLSDFAELHDTLHRIICVFVPDTDKALHTASDLLKRTAHRLEARKGAHCK